MNTPHKNIIRGASALLAFFTVGALPIQAGLLAIDTFDGSALGDINGKSGGTGWNGAWSVATVTANAAVVSANEITYTFGGVTLGGGNSLKLLNGSNPLQRDVFASADTSGQDYYVSFIFNNTGTTFAGWQAKDANVDITNDTIGYTNNGTVGARVGNTSSASAAVFTDNTTHFVVIAYTGWNGSNYLTSKIWIDPTTGGEGSNTVSASYTGTAGKGSSGFLGLYVRTANFDPTNSEFMYVDDIRVGTGWTSVVPTAIPEPSTYALLAGLATIVLTVARRRVSR